MKNDAELNKKRGQRLKECREAARMTQEILADITNYSVQTVSYIENGKRGMSKESAYTFSKYLNVRMEYLLCDDDFKTVEDIYYDAVAFEKLEKNLGDTVTENGYLIAEWFGKKIAEYTESESEFIGPIYNVDKYIVLTPENKFVTSTGEKYEDLIKEINDFIVFKMRKFATSCPPSSATEIEYFKKFFNMDDEEFEDLLSDR